MKNLTFALLLVLSFWTSCTVPESEILERYDDEDRAYSPAELTGIFEYMKSMVPEEIRIVALDEQLNPLDSFVVDRERNYATSYDFLTPSRDYEYPFAKIVLVFPQGNNGKMEFAQYVRFYSSIGDIPLHLYGALISERVKTLVQKEGYKFDDAELVAKEELRKVLGVSRVTITGADRFIGWQGGEYGSSRYGRDDLFDLLPYVICRHEISDSVFYSDFKEFRDSFAKDGTVDSSVMVRAADAWLSTFEASVENKKKCLYESVSRDSGEGVKVFDNEFIQRAYGLDDSWTSEGKLKIENKSSEYYGRTIINDPSYIKSVASPWRLQSLFEDTVGVCKHSGRGYVEHDGTSYVCRDYSHIWEKETNRDTLLLYKYGNCLKGYDMDGMAAYVNDSMFVCDASGTKGVWRFVKALSDEDPLSDYMGECPGENFGKTKSMVNGDYYKCGYEGWTQITVPDALYYECDDRRDSTYSKYEGKYYFCADSAWKEVSEDDVIYPVQQGAPCDSAHLAEVERYGSKYFVCRGKNDEASSRSVHWSVATAQEAAIYDYNLNLGTLVCPKGRKGTRIWWDENAEMLYGCYDGSAVMIKVANVDDDAQQLFAGGEFVDNSTYEVTVDGYKYGFDKFYWDDLAKNGWNMYVYMEYSYKKKID